MAVKLENIYTDLDELPIYNFYKCFNGDLKYLCKDRKIQNRELLSKHWNKLYNVFCELTFSNSMLRYYRLCSEIEFLKNKQIYAPVLLNLLLKTPINDREDIYKELSNWKININSKKDLDTQVSTALKNIKGSKNKLKRKNEELGSIKNKPVKTLTLQEQKAKLHLTLNIQVDLHNTSVTEWLAYWDEVKNLKQKDE